MLTAAGNVTITFKKKGVRKPVARRVKALVAGRNTFKVGAQIGALRLKPGRYVVVATTEVSRKRAKLKVVR